MRENGKNIGRTKEVNGFIEFSRKYEKRGELEETDGGKQLYQGSD